MNKRFILIVIGQIMNVFAAAFLIVLILGTIAASYFVGFSGGFNKGVTDTYNQISDYLVKRNVEPPEVSKSDNNRVIIIEKEPESGPRDVNWGGPELWSLVNKRRIEFGVNPLEQRDDLCTIASIRLNELIELGSLDGHEGFSSLQDRRADIKEIFERYNTVAEFLLYGAETAEEAVGLWEDTLAHKKLLTAGEYVWGCVYAQYSFAVAITAY